MNRHFKLIGLTLLVTFKLSSLLPGADWHPANLLGMETQVLLRDDKRVLAALEFQFLSASGTKFRDAPLPV